MDRQTKGRPNIKKDIWRDKQMENGWLNEFKGQIDKLLDVRAERPIDR
jgi:hypothetical protein